MEKILVIDDSEDILRTVQTYLCESYIVLTAKYGEKGLEIFDKERPGVVITDIRMPGMDGIDLLREVKAIDKDTEVILITGNGDMKDVIKSLRLGASDFMLKPTDVGLLELIIDKAFQKRMSKQEIDVLMDKFDALVSRSIQDLGEGKDLDFTQLKEEMEEIDLRYSKWKSSR